MSYGIQLKFVMDLLLEMRISSHIVTNPTENISAEIDLGLRAMLHGTNNYAKLAAYPINSAKHNTVYPILSAVMSLYSCICWQRKTTPCGRKIQTAPAGG